jgi:hypothetical protein
LPWSLVLIACEADPLESSAMCPSFGVSIESFDFSEAILIVAVVLFGESVDLQNIKTENSSVLV